MLYICESWWVSRLCCTCESWWVSRLCYTCESWWVFSVPVRAGGCLAWTCWCRSPCSARWGPPCGRWGTWRRRRDELSKLTKSYFCFCFLATNKTITFQILYTSLSERKSLRHLQLHLDICTQLSDFSCLCRQQPASDSVNMHGYGRYADLLTYLVTESTSMATRISCQRSCWHAYFSLISWRKPVY